MLEVLKNKIEQIKFNFARKNASPYVRTCNYFNECRKSSDGTCVGCNTWLDINGIRKASKNG